MAHDILKKLEQDGYTPEQVEEGLINIQIILPEAIDPEDPQHITEVKSGIRLINSIRKALKE